MMQRLISAAREMLVDSEVMGCILIGFLRILQRYGTAPKKFYNLWAPRSRIYHFLVQVKTCLTCYWYCSGLPSNRQISQDMPNSKTYWHFENEYQWHLSGICLYPEPLPNSRIQRIAVQKYNPCLQHGREFNSITDFKKRVGMLATKGEWRIGYAKPHKNVGVWAPKRAEFWYRDSLEVLKYLVGDARLASEMKWAPEKVYNPNGQRLYSELWSTDWWWEKQVYSYGTLF